MFGLSTVGIHSVTNPIRRMTAALHVYGGDFFTPGRSEWDAETLRERPLDREATRASGRLLRTREAAVSGASKSVSTAR